MMPKNTISIFLLSFLIFCSPSFGKIREGVGAPEKKTTVSSQNKKTDAKPRKYKLGGVKDESSMDGWQKTGRFLLTVGSLGILAITPGASFSFSSGGTSVQINKRR
ncbi:MAG: hypothetical protein LHV69_04850 [Elusimicrobia bacterium]|nr:hypothetical protein [Candidatus Obscuribacterium magneticum]MCB4756351.1 hypothetical protein [Candidatus Obscuribacterium magneticum]